MNWITEMQFTFAQFYVFCFAHFVAGMCIGIWLANRKWREKGDHEYMNRMASGGHLYQVRRER